jgi:hypothetical protein
VQTTSWTRCSGFPDKSTRVTNVGASSLVRRLFCSVTWPARDAEGPALYDVYKELEHLVVASDFEEFGFTEIWLMDYAPQYTSRRSMPKRGWPGLNDRP